MGTIKTKHVVFITGAFVTHLGWSRWMEYFERSGYQTVAPPWPYKETDPSVLRDRPPYDTDLALMHFHELVGHYQKIIAGLPEKPIVIGHSLGGLITQIIINRGLAAAGVAIHSVPPFGVIPFEFSFIRGGWRSLGLFTSRRETYLMSFSDWQYAFVNGMPLAEQRQAYIDNIIPESKTVARGVLSFDARVDFQQKHVPLLLTSGDEDNIIPASLNLRNFRRYRQNGSVTDYKEFKGRNHFVLGQSTWQEDAEYILDWLARV